MDESQEVEEATSWEKVRAEALREKAEYEALTVNPGWVKLRAWMEEQVTERTNAIVLKPCTGVKDQLEAEYSKGEIATFRLIMHMVTSRIEELTEVARSITDVTDDSTADAEAAE